MFKLSNLNEAKYQERVQHKVLYGFKRRNVGRPILLANISNEIEIRNIALNLSNFTPNSQFLAYTITCFVSGGFRVSESTKSHDIERMEPGTPILNLKYKSYLLWN